jgi:hypothetical protein
MPAKLAVPVPSVLGKVVCTESPATVAVANASEVGVAPMRWMLPVHPPVPSLSSKAPRLVLGPVAKVPTQQPDGVCADAEMALVPANRSAAAIEHACRVMSLPSESERERRSRMTYLRSITKRRPEMNSSSDGAGPRPES